jgi:hypothetical protein
MRTTLIALGVASLFTAFGFGQTDKTFYFTQSMSDAELGATVMLVRTIVDLQDISSDPEHHSVKMHGTVDKLVAADWLFQQLDHPVAQAAGPEYKIPGQHGEETIRVLRLSPAATKADLSGLTTAIRTVADLQRLFPYEKLNVIVGRGEPAKMALADWTVRQLNPYDGKAPTTDSPAIPSPLRDLRLVDANDVVQVLRMDPNATNGELTATVTAIRTIADLQRLFPYRTGNAMIGSGSPEKMAVAAWLVGELRKPADAHVVHQTRLTGQMDDVVRLFDIGGHVDLTRLVTEIRTTMGIQRVFPLDARSAVIVRGRPDQMPAIEAIVSKSTTGAN